MVECEHVQLSFISSVNANIAGYCRPNSQKRNSAASLTVSRNKKDVQSDAEASTFPPPLVLPGDDLSVDPRYPPQSLRSWLRLPERNDVTPSKNVIYVAATPDIDSEVSFVKTWMQPQKLDSSKIPTPNVNDVVDYLSAFYHGLQVRLLPPPNLTFGAWDTNVKSKSKANIPRYIGMNTQTESTGIRTRRSKDGVFPAQLNLDDLLDVAISILPNDAYALLLLVNHDLYEDEDDEFVCGRACRANLQAQEEE
ncbi:hypothetical protein H0H81_005735 [Sphagnurus paluster]|uniref:Uncharacterized protein n=1 Tax=Sphagnurus paluster TaxID=117069 RepID=A0A9P7GLJ3_9AGAR|nr:hypothetical protein H0H81_005735 [Sphagnurus paluster]